MAPDRIWTHTHRWRPTESGQEMDMLTIDLLRSMIHNLVIGQWGTCSHRAGTVTLAQRANIAERTSPLTCGSFSSILFVSLPFVVGSKHHKTFSNVLLYILFHINVTVCVFADHFYICRHFCWTAFSFNSIIFSLKICVENIMALQNQIVWLGHIDFNWKRKISDNIQNIIHWTYNVVLRC